MVIVALEGIDGSGKTTLAAALRTRLSWTFLRFPDRTTESGKVIDWLLKRNIVIPAEVFMINMEEAQLQKGRNYIIDRYTLSGLVYNDNYSIKIPPPDLTVFIDCNADTAYRRLLGSKLETYEHNGDRYYNRYKAALHTLDPLSVVTVSPSLSPDEAADKIVSVIASKWSSLSS